LRESRGKRESRRRETAELSEKPQKITRLIQEMNQKILRIPCLANVFDAGFRIYTAKSLISTSNLRRLFWELRRISLAINCLRYMNATFQQVLLFVSIVYPPNRNFRFTRNPYHYF